MRRREARGAWGVGRGAGPDVGEAEAGAEDSGWLAPAASKRSCIAIALAHRVHARRWVAHAAEGRVLAQLRDVGDHLVVVGALQPAKVVDAPALDGLEHLDQVRQVGRLGVVVAALLVAALLVVTTTLLVAALFRGRRGCVGRSRIRKRDRGRVAAEA